MKKVLLILLLITSVAFAKKPIGMASGDRVPPTNEHSVTEVENGRAMSLIYSGASTLGATGASVTTSWMHTGWTDADGVKAEAVSGLLASRFDATTFTLLIELSSGGDSVGLASARFETAIDTSANEVWNADKTNLFLQDGNADSSFYGQWLFEEITADSISVSQSDTLTFSYPLRVLHPGWIRVVYTAPSDFEDTQTVNWSLICKNGG